MTALALTAAMVAGMAAPAYAGTYYIGDGNITITKDESGTYVKQGNNSSNNGKGDLDNTDIVIKGGKRSEDTTGTGSDDTTGGEENAPKPGGTPTPAEGTESTESNHSAPESQFTYTGASLKVASANDDEETRNESTTVLKRAAENFKNTAENVTNYVIRIINKATGNDNTLNVTLDNVNIDVSSSKTNNAALSVEGAGDTKITLEGKNTLTSGNQCAGLEHNEESMGTTGKLTITSGTDDNGSNTGSLTATGSGASAGIGSGTFSFGSGAGTIEITGGDITAIGSSDGAGIGSGYGATGNTNITISGTAKINAQTKQGGAGIGSGSGATGNTNITISGGTIEKAQGGQGYGRYHDAGDGIHSDGDLTISGNATIDSAIGGSCGSDASDRNAGHGIYSGGKLTISGGTIGTAQGGNATDRNKNAGDGIYSVGELTISGGTIGTAQGGSGISGGYGIRSNQELTIEGGRIEQAAGGAATGSYGTGGSGIRSDSSVKIWGGTITKATGGSGKSGGDGIGSYGALTISGSAKIETAQGGASTNGNGGSGISSGDILTIEGSANIGTAQGGASTNGTGGDGIHSGSVVKISGDTITKATGGNATGENSTGGSGIGGSFVNIAGGTISAAGGSGKSGGAGVSTESGIVSIGNSDTPLDLTATAPDADNAIRGRDGKKLDEIIHLEENGKRGLVKLVENGVTRLFHNGVYTKSIYPAGSETHPLGDWVITKKPTCTEPGERQRSCKIEHCVVTETEELPALGHQWSGWMPVQGDSSREYRICAVCNEVEYRDVSHNSGSGDSTISTGLRVLDPAQADILQNAQLVRLNRISDVLYIDVSHETASLQGVLSDLTGLRSERIGTVVFSTERCTSTLSLSDVAALGAGDTPFTLRHSGSTATFTVGGADHSALLR